MQEEYRTHHQCTPSPATTTKPYLKGAAPFMSIKAPGAWRLPSHALRHPSAAAHETEHFWTQNPVQPCCNLPTTVSCFPASSSKEKLIYCGYIPWTILQSSLQQLQPSSSFSVDSHLSCNQLRATSWFSMVKKQPFLLGEEVRDTEVILKPVINYFAKSPFNYS